jgi:hypothetical protein
MSLLLYFAVIFSNFYGIRALLYQKDPLFQVLLIYAIFASCLMHIAELPRFIEGSNIKTLKTVPLYNYLVIFDKVFAFSICIYGFITNYQLILSEYLIYSIISIVICILSTEFEVSQNNIIIFSVLHTMWHLLAFHLAYLISNV